MAWSKVMACGYRCQGTNMNQPLNQPPVHSTTRTTMGRPPWARPSPTSARGQINDWGRAWETSNMLGQTHVQKTYHEECRTAKLKYIPLPIYCRRCICTIWHMCLQVVANARQMKATCIGNLYNIYILYININFCMHTRVYALIHAHTPNSSYF